MKWPVLILTLCTLVICFSIASESASAQTYGGYGYVSDYPVEQSMRDLKIASLYEGTNGIQAMDLIGRKFLKNGGENLKRYLGHVADELKQAGAKAELKPLADKVLAAIDRFGKAALHIGKNAADQAYVGLVATPFLRAFGSALGCVPLGPSRDSLNISFP